MRSCSRARDTASCEGQAPNRDAAAWWPGQAARGNTTTRTAHPRRSRNLAILSTGPDKRLGSPTVTVNAARRDGELYAISSVTLQTDGGRRNGTHTRGSGGRRHSLRLVTVISDLYITTKYEGFEIEPNRPQPNTKTTVTVEPSGAISGFHGPRIRLLWNRSGGGLEESWSCHHWQEPGSVGGLNWQGAVISSSLEMKHYGHW